MTRRTSRRTLAATGRLTAAVLALALVGCGEQGDTPTRLELWTLALRPTFTEYVEGVIASFEQDRPGVEVVWVDVPFSALNRKLVAAAAAGRAPDVVNFSDMQFARFASLGAMADLRGRLPGDPHARYAPGALRIAEMNDRLLGAPWYLTTPIRMINLQRLEEGGLTPDDLGGTWAELREQARDYHAKTGGFLFSLSLGEESELPGMLLADGLAPFTTDDAGRLRAALTRDAVVEAVEQWVDLYRSGALPRESATAGHAAHIDSYQNGRIALVQTGANFLSRIADAAPDVYEQTRVMPAVTGALGRSHVAVMLLAVASTSEHPELAAELVWHLTSPENQLAFCRIVNILPSTLASLDDPHFDPPSDVEGVEHRLAEARALSAQALPDAVAFTPALETWPDLRQAFNERIKAALLDGADVRETLTEIEREWDRLLGAAIPASMDAVPRPTALKGASP